MNEPSYKVSITVEESTGRLMAAYFRIRQGKTAETREVLAGRAFADYDPAGKLLGVELLAPCTVDVLDDIAREEPEPVKQFFRRAAPREMIVA